MAKKPALVRSVTSPTTATKQILLVAMVVVDGLPGDAGLGGDQVDVGAAKAFAAKDVRGSVEDRHPLGGMAAQVGKCQEHWSVVIRNL